MKKTKSVVKYLLTLVVLVLVIFGGFVFLGGHQSGKQEMVSSARTSKKRSPIKKHIRLVALGDSLTHGVGDTTGRGGYVYLIKTKIQKQYHTHVLTSNYGKTGDRSDQIEQRLKQQKTMQRKLRRADVITLTAGGNDLMQVMENNMEYLATDNLQKIMPQNEKKYLQKLSSLLKTIRHYNSHAPIFFFSVYNPFYVYFPTLTQMQSYTNKWNSIAKQASSEFNNVYFVNICNQMSEGQYLHHSKKSLKANANVNLNSVSNNKVEQILSDGREKNDYLSSQDHFHPNLKGYRYMTSKLQESMNQHKKLWLMKGAK